MCSNAQLIQTSVRFVHIIQTELHFFRQKWKLSPRRPVAYLGAGSVVVQSGQAGEVLFGDGWSRLGGDQTVGVRWVSNHQDLKIKRVRQT